MKYLAPAVTALLLVSACGGGDGDSSNASSDQRETMAATMVRHGLDGEVASCVADDLGLRLTPSMYAEVLAADSADDIPPAWQPAVAGATDVCTSGGQPDTERPADDADDADSADPEPSVQADAPPTEEAEPLPKGSPPPDADG